MSGDLEDFLRRAAQRRQAKAAQANQPAAAPRKRPQYSNSRTERVTRTVETQATDEVLVAEVVDHHSTNQYDRRETGTQRQQAETAQKQAEAAATRSAAGQSSTKNDAASSALNSQAGIELLAALRSPGGVRQAILLREILDRPTHRWQ
ncbi:hypothetical protein N9D23_07885 [Rubripirellula sp.]|nr:hypothetical protein [Rubripirellula sp.]MDF1840170.1 hypothetical protein [Rubripirellula sp.]